jgi:hypothetical protein
MRTRHLIIAAVIVAVALPSAAGRKKKYSHQEYFEHYEGTATCLTCHEDEAVTFFHSQHYQWRGETPNVTTADGEKHGKMDMINDFCTSPVPNWIGEVTNDEGKVLASGCSKCHAGFGKMPSETLSREQLENIDCLICHASGYRREVYQKENGEWGWRPILWKNIEGLDSVSKRISKPTRTMCLRCHSASGGGPNFKRGDIEYELVETDADFDVHMDAEGNDLHCVDCHADQNHRVMGRGVDMVASDTATRLSCDNGMCHESDPHAKEMLNRHVAKLSCTTCHIPTFAKADATDVYRDWSDTHFDESAGKFKAHIETQSDVVPTYAWFDGTSFNQLPQQPVTLTEDGLVPIALPAADRGTEGARIHPFKVHRGRLPVAKDSRWLLPITTEEFYAHGDIERAVREAAEIAYGLHDVEFEWVETIRYMGINHGVVPASDALRCLDCHGTDTRLDWTALGYEADPLAAALKPSH